MNPITDGQTIGYYSTQMEKCDVCQKRRTLLDGVCHECRVAENDQRKPDYIDPETGEEFYAGGFAL